MAEKDHACILYDTKSRTSMLVPGSSHGIVYLQEQALYEPKVLEPRDSIEIGESLFTFIPFCEGSFDWEDTEKP